MAIVPDSLFQVRFQIYCPPHSAVRIRDSPALKSGCLESHEISHELSVNIFRKNLEVLINSYNTHLCDSSIKR